VSPAQKRKEEKARVAAEKAAWREAEEAEAARVAAEEKAARAATFVHEVACDACDAPIVGPRFRNSTEGLDVCGSCFELLDEEDLPGNRADYELVPVD
jgi:hypothetical protein